MISRVLTAEQIKKIHDASLRILEDIGVIIPHDEVLRRFADLRADVNFKTQRVKIPSDLVMQCISQAGKKFTLFGRDLSKKAEFGYGKRNYNSIAGEALWIDNIGEKRRYVTKEDVVTASQFGDALECINVVGAMADPHEIPVEYRSIEVFATMVGNTTKPITFWFHNRSSTKYLIDMIIALRGDEKRAKEFPLCYPFLEPISPLRFPFNGAALC